MPVPTRAHRSTLRQGARSSIHASVSASRAALLASAGSGFSSESAARKVRGSTCQSAKAFKTSLNRFYTHLDISKHIYIYL